MFSIIFFDIIGETISFLKIREEENHMNISDLQVFQIVAEKGTITEAAKQLNYVQSNITSRIQKLEQHLHTKLFYRHRRGMTPTPEGKKLMTYTNKILSLTDEMEKVLQSKTEPAGQLHIGTVETVIKLPYILNVYNKNYDQVDLSLYTGVTEKLRHDVLQHKLDGAFVIETSQHPELSSYPVFSEELIIVSSPEVTTWKQIKEEPFLCFSKGCAYRERMEAWYESQQIRPKKVMELGSFETILSSVAIGLGITCLPKSAVTRLIQKGTIKAHSLPGKYRKIKTIFIRRKDAVMTTTIEKFIETIELTKNKSQQQITIL